MDLGIDVTGYYIYEGQSLWGQALWPPPIITPAVFTDSSAKNLKPNENNNLFKVSYIFREDAFDPFARIRRGRFYKITEREQPKTWHVYPHPANTAEMSVPSAHKGFRKELITFSSFHLFDELSQIIRKQILILLGIKSGFSLWTLINIEVTIHNEEIVVLKSRKTFGALPNLIPEKIPGRRLSILQEKLEILNADIFKASPESVIDRSRDVASAIIGIYAENEGIGDLKDDLGKLIGKLKSKQENIKNIVINAADIIRLFHARAKPSEQAKRSFRNIYEQDAELAIQCIGTILCEIGWAKWD